MDLGLEGKAVIVTGGTRGIGNACAVALGSEGAQVIVCGRDQKNLASALEAFDAKGIKSAGVIADLSKKDGASLVYDKAMSAFGKVDVVINNVGGALGSTLSETTEEQWHETFELNLFSAIRLTKLAVPQMVERHWGRIICIGSIYGREYGGGMTYMTAKASLMAFTKNLSRQVAQHNVLVNTVNPGSIAHPGGSWQKRIDSDPEAMKDFVKGNLPLGRFGRSDELASLVAFMASEKGSYLTGTSWNVDGGQSKSLI